MPPSEANPSTAAVVSGSLKTGQEINALDRTVLRGVAWVGALKWTAQLVTWGSTIVIARLLSARDYGIVGMAVLFLGLVSYLSEFGVGAAVIAFRDLPRAQTAALNTLSIATGCLAFMVCGAAAPALARFFAMPQLSAIVVAMGAALALSSLQTVPNGLLQRQMRFKLVSVIEALRAIVTAGVTLALAAMHHGYWSLVIGNIAGTASATAAAVAVCPQPFALRGLRSVQHAMRFSYNVVVARISWYFYSNADFAVAAKFLGASVLGAYTLAWNLANLPVDKITGVLNGVLPSLFSAVQDDKKALHRYLLILMEVLAVVTLPVCFGMALIAPDAVPFIFGVKWQPAVVPLQILCVLGAARSFFVVLSTALVMCGESAYNLRISVFAAVVFPVLFWLGSHWGASGIALGWLLGYPLIAIAAYRRIAVLLGGGGTGFFGAIRLPLFASGCMSVSVWLLQRLLRTDLPKTGVLALEVVAGASVYGALIALFGNRRILAAIKMLRHGSPSLEMVNYEVDVPTATP